MGSMRETQAPGIQNHDAKQMWKRHTKNKLNETKPSKNYNKAIKIPKEKQWIHLKSGHLASSPTKCPQGGNPIV